MGLAPDPLRNKLLSEVGTYLRRNFFLRSSQRFEFVPTRVWAHSTLVLDTLQKLHYSLHQSPAGSTIHQANGKTISDEIPGKATNPLPKHITPTRLQATQPNCAPPNRSDLVHFVFAAVLKSMS